MEPGSVAVFGEGDDLLQAIDIGGNGFTTVLFRKTGIRRAVDNGARPVAERAVAVGVEAA